MTCYQVVILSPLEKDDFQWRFLPDERPPPPSAKWWSQTDPPRVPLFSPSFASLPALDFVSMPLLIVPAFAHPPPSFLFLEKDLGLPRISSHTRGRLPPFPVRYFR